MNQACLSKKIYISGALTGIKESEKIKDFYESIGLLCDQLAFQTHIPHLYTDPLKNPEISPRQVFEMDKRQVNAADLVIAYLGCPSFGVGMELAYADTNNIPIILLYERERIISRFPRGIPSIVAEIQFTSYEDALEQLRNILINWI
ncbi:MAG: XRE family transcriptional regulator [Leptolyngbyaceae cyanobacterium RU_5_1]|nr:XRE family transcriptional regulator [Leptolyngbyaceae cyanobacterium RU_5_1]